MLRISLLLASARALQAPPRAHRATHLRAAEAALAVDAADAFDQFGVAAVAASAKLASQDPAGEKPSDAQTRGVVLATAAAGAVAVLAAAPKTARASIAEPVQPAVASGIPNKLARQLLQIERLNVDSNGSGDRRTHKPRLDISGNSAKVCIDGYEPEGSDRVQFIWLKNEEADAINEAIQARRIERGELLPDRTAAGRGDQLLLVGDTVQTRRNDRDTGVENRALWTIRSIGPSGIELISTTDGLQVRTVSAGYAAEHVQLAYASTVHGIQGETTDVSIVGPGVDAAGLYVGMTRGRTSNTAVVIAGSPGRARELIADSMLRGLPETACTAK